MPLPTKLQQIVIYVPPIDKQQLNAVRRKAGERTGRHISESAYVGRVLRLHLNRLTKPTA